jgi:hypothetical protein
MTWRASPGDAHPVASGEQRMKRSVDSPSRWKLMLEHQESGGDIVLCKKGVADKVVWFL